MSLEAKVVAITGASGGIGRATAREMARRGAHVGLIARGRERLEHAAAEVGEYAGRACVAPADVADAAAVEAAAARIEAELVQLPGHNTPQFEWVGTPLRRHPKPVPPIYQPEVAARAIAHAAEHPRREIWVGLPTAYTILGEKLAPGFMDRYLARTNVQAQQAERPIDPTQREDNLDAPPPGDPGAHGIFDAEARDRSHQLWLNTHGRALAGAAAGAAAAGAAVAISRRG
jgi:hypothetical protein